MNPNEQVRTREKILYSVCKFDPEDTGQDLGGTTKIEALEAMQTFADQQCAERDERIKELEKENDRLKDEINREFLQ